MQTFYAVVDGEGEVVILVEDLEPDFVSGVPMILTSKEDAERTMAEIKSYRPNLIASVRKVEVKEVISEK